MAMRKLDVRGAKCPIPIVKAKKEIDTMAPGDLLEVTATDPGSVPAAAVAQTAEREPARAEGLA